MTLPRWIIGSIVVLLLLGGLLWLVRASIRRSTDPARLRLKWIATILILGTFGAAVFTGTGNSVGGAFVVPFVCLVIGIIMSVLWAPHIGELLAGTITSAMDGGNEEVIQEPLYSSAIAKRKRGLYQQAIYDIQAQLQNFPTDVTGQLLLAEIQAENLRDLEAAQITIDRLLNQPNHAPVNTACALNLMADWRLKYDLDSDAARHCLDRIVELLPDTPQSHAAQQRIAHLGDDTTRLAQHDPAPVKLRPGAGKIGLMIDSASLRPPEESPESIAARYVHQLEEHPSDDSTREKLARLYAEHYQRIDLAVAQLEELIAQANVSDSAKVRWLNMIADIQMKQGQDPQSGRRTLERIIELFPDRAAAQLAQNRLNLLQLELRGTKKSQAIKLGSYEKNIGLKSSTGPEHRRSRQE